MKKRSITRMCAGKKRFKTRELAKTSKNNIKKNAGTILRCYLCQICKGWHLTNDGEKSGKVGKRK